MGLVRSLALPLFQPGVPRAAAAIPIGGCRVLLASARSLARSLCLSPPLSLSLSLLIYLSLSRA